MAKKNRIKGSKKGAKTGNKSSGRLKAFLRSQKTRRILGLLILFISVYCLIAFTSFVFTWKADQSMLSDKWLSVLQEGNYDAENWLGPFGAMVGHFFIHQWFGVMSFLFILIFLACGFRVLFKKNILPLGKTAVASIMAMVVFSPVLAYLFTTENTQFIGGSFGYELNHTLLGIVGNVGTALLLLFAAIAYIVLVFNPNFGWLGSLAKRAQKGSAGMMEKSRGASPFREDEDEKEDFQDTIGEMDQFDQATSQVDLTDDDDGEADTKKKEAEKDKGPELEMEVEQSNGEPEAAQADASPENAESNSDEEDFSVATPTE
jgi:hypothetical protein